MSRRPRAPEGTRIYAIGDIHGRNDLLCELLTRIGEDDRGRATVARRVVVHLGDYVDRGPDSRGVIEHCVTWAHGAFEPIFLLGNHEHIMLDFLDGGDVFDLWTMNGGDATLRSYGVTAAGADCRAELAAALPASHLAFLRRLWISVHLGDYFFVHAGIRPGVPLSGQTQNDMLWIREPFLDSRRDHGAVVVHGHSITASPTLRGNRIGIDTGAYRTGQLTALRLEGEQCALLEDAC